jgi:hypothetical protein
MLDGFYLFTAQLSNALAVISIGYYYYFFTSVLAGSEVLLSNVQNCMNDNIRQTGNLTSGYRSALGPGFLSSLNMSFIYGSEVYLENVIGFIYSKCD